MAPKVQGSERSIYKSMEEEIFEFLNTTKWTDKEFNVEERIDCNILINIDKRKSTSNFKGSIQVSSGRVVYNSSYNTSILNYNDKDFVFEYVENTPIRFSLERFRSNLSSVLAYYAYMIIGYDFDTFSLEGGNPYFSKAQTIVNNAQNASEPGWKAHEGTKNRYWLVENALHNVFKPLRKCYYRYHRHGLDKMYDNTKEARKEILNSLKLLEKVHKQRPASFNMQLFFSAKKDEIIKIFSKGSPKIKNEAFRLLKKINPSNISEYKKIKG